MCQNLFGTYDILALYPNSIEIPFRLLSYKKNVKRMKMYIHAWSENMCACNFLIRGHIISFRLMTKKVKKFEENYLNDWRLKSVFLFENL